MNYVFLCACVMFHLLFSLVYEIFVQYPSIYKIQSRFYRDTRCNARGILLVLTMGKPTKLHDVQKLAGRVAALSRFRCSIGRKGASFLCTYEEVR
jgi:hypothetical protein